MTDYEHKAFLHRCANMVKTAKQVKEGKYGDVFIRTKDGEAYLYESTTHLVRKLPPDSSKMTYDESKIEFGKRLKNIINYLSISQGELAEMIGVSRQMINRYISGTTAPSFIVVDDIARAIGCSLDDFRYLD